ncbi:MAG TPA: FtsX-like permease family protein, partial [Castellaniella sp.]|nr:FtsX-like permease family protein [Castellaniella sp.]
FGLGPRVMMTRAAMEGAGLLAEGSRATERYLFKLDEGADIAAVRAEVEKILPDALVTDFRETNPELTHGLDHATGLLSLICLVAMVLGAIGVGMAMRAHLQQRIEVLAIMKSMGATSADILRIYMLQTVFLGLLGGLIGVAAGLAVQYAFPSLLGTLLPLHPALAVAAKPMAAALAVGVLTTVLFCLPPLLDVRNVRPIAVLRHTVDSSDAGGWLQRQWERKLQWASIIVIVAGLAGIATVLSDSWLVGRWFAGSLAAVLAVVLGLSWATLRGLRAFLARTRAGLPSAVRHGLANLHRPGNQSAAVLAALGTGVMLTLAVFLMQSAVVREMRSEVAPGTPNVFLVDIAPDEIAGVKTLLAGLPGVTGEMETVPVIQSRMVSIDGVSVEKLKTEDYPRRMLRSVSLAWSEGVPAGTTVLEGKWWGKGDKSGLAVAERAARRLHLKVGSTVEFEVSDHKVSTRVAAIYKVDGEHAYARSEFILAPALLKGVPATWYGAAHFAPAEIAPMERALFAKYPTITVVSLADILDTVQRVVGHITLVVRFLAAFSILAGVVILASSIASTRFRRIREVVVLKTLGATRARVAQVFSVEFAVLGLLAGVVGAVFANLLARVLLHRMKVPYHLDLGVAAITVAATAALAVLTGWAASYRILGQRPLEVLREE